MVDKIFLLMKEMGINDKQLILATGLSNGVVTDWRKGRSKPSTDAIIKIANYFGVTTDYLLGVEESNISIIKKKSPDELTTEDKLRLYFYEKTGREPTDDELCKLDDYVDIFIKAHQK